MQDPFLNQARRDRLPLVIRLLDGLELHAQLTGFDRFCLSVDADGVRQLIFKHAVATIAVAGTPRPAR